MIKKKLTSFKTPHQLKLLVASILGIGFLPASGTWGSLVALSFAPIICGCPFLTLGLVAFSFILGIWAIPALIKGQSDKDPKFVIIDEFMGQLVVFAFLPNDFANPLTYLWGFLLFRLFDILKPWPVSFYDQKMHNSWGIMLDDLMAGIYAACVLAFVQMISLY